MRPEWLVRAQGRNKHQLGLEAVAIPLCSSPWLGTSCPGLGLVLSSAWNAFSSSCGLPSKQHPVQLSSTQGII